MLIESSKGDEHSPCQQSPRHNVILSICKTLASLQQLSGCLQDPVPLFGLFGWQQIFQVAHSLRPLVRASHVGVGTYTNNTALVLNTETCNGDISHSKPCSNFFAIEEVFFL